MFLFLVVILCLNESFATSSGERVNINDSVGLLETLSDNPEPEPVIDPCPEIVGPDYTTDLMPGAFLCDDIQVGQHFTANAARPQSPTGVMMKYTLFRAGQDRYQIRVNPKFWTSTPVSGDQRDTLTSELTDMMKSSELASCLQKINPIKGAGLEFDIVLDSNAPQVDVQFSNRPGRAHSEHYFSTSRCGTFVHEIMHYLGLPDEYVDNRYPARKISQGLNLMADQNDLFSEEYGYYQLNLCSKLSATDRETGEEINLEGFTRDQLVNPEQEIDPFANSGDLNWYDQQRLKAVTMRAADAEISCSENLSGVTKRLPLVNHDFEIGDVVRTRFEGGQVTITPGSIGSNYVVVAIVEEALRDRDMLRQDQVNSILYPMCAEKNQRFYDCSEFAYEREPNLEEVPEHCR